VQKQQQTQQFQQTNMLKKLIKKIAGTGYNYLQNIILPSKISFLFSSRNQIIVGIILNKLNVSVEIISIILLFL
jgi:hypothetical protein